MKSIDSMSDPDLLETSSYDEDDYDQKPNGPVEFYNWQIQFLR